MLHLRLIVPTARVEAVVEVLRASTATTGLVHLPGSAVDPPGDVVLVDVVKEGADAVLEGLKGLGLEREGQIAADPVDFVISDRARQARLDTPGDEADAVVWEQLASRVHDDTSLSASYLAFLVIATMLAAVGVATDSVVLVIGAMVVGPEFGPLAGACVALVARRPRLAVRSSVALVVGFVLAIAITWGFAEVVLATGLVDAAVLDDEGRATGFASRPDVLSAVVALLAGAAGMLSLTSAKSSALVGVLVSVTTVPAAGNLSLAMAAGDADLAAGSAGQLGLNLVCLVVAGALTLLGQAVWAPGAGADRLERLVRPRRP